MTTNNLLEKTEDTGKITYQDLKRSATGPVAKFFSNGTLKALPTEDTPDGKPRMRFVVSTTTIDLVGDIMSEAFIDKMLAQAIGKTFFVNHSYIIPQDVLGKVESGRKFNEKMTDPVTGETGTYLLLEFVVLVAMSNPVAVKTYELVKEDEIKLGASVSIIILATTAGKNGTSIIQDGYYLETSAVGIPANQASWVQSIQKAFREWERTNKTNNEPALAPLPPTNQPEIISNDEETKSMTTPNPAAQQPPEVVKKNVFEDVIAFDTEMTCYDLAYSLCSAVSNLLDQAGSGYMTDPAALLDELLADFSQAVKMLVAPTLASMTAPAGEEKAAGQGADRVVVPTIEQVKQYFTWKERPESTDQADPVNVNKDGGGSGSSGSSKDDPYQEMHDYCLSKGASCKDMDPDDTAADKNINAEQAQALSKAFEVKTTLEKEITDLKTALANASTESKQWEAMSRLLKEKLHEYLKQPASF